MRISDWSSDVCSSDLRDEGRPALPVRIGLHSGPVAVGNIGSPSRINYTIVGDAVNTAARIEALGSRMQRDDEDCLVLAGAATVCAAGLDVPHSSLGPRLPRGHSAKIEIFRKSGRATGGERGCQ